MLPAECWKMAKFQGVWFFLLLFLSPVIGRAASSQQGKKNLRQKSLQQVIQVQTLIRPQMNKPGVCVPALALALPVPRCGSSRWLCTRVWLKRFIQGSAKVRWQSRNGLGSRRGVCQPFPLPDMLIPGCAFPGRLKFLGLLVCGMLSFWVKNCSSRTQHLLKKQTQPERPGEKKWSKTRENNPSKALCRLFLPQPALAR